MRSMSYTRATLTVLALALGATALVVAPAAAKRSDKARRSAFSLFAVPIDILQGQCKDTFVQVMNSGFPGGLMSVDEAVKTMNQGCHKG